MTTALCPGCRVLRNLQTAVTVWKADEDDGGRRMRTESHHCEVCGVFVSSEDREETAPVDPGAHQGNDRERPHDPTRGPGDGSPVVPPQPRPTPLEDAAAVISGPSK